MLRVVDLEVGYEGLRVIRRLSLYVKRGETVALLGPNGAGKSTLMNAIAGLVKPSSGAVYFGEKRVDGAQPDRIARMGIAYVTETRNLFANMSVLENLQVGATRLNKEVAKDALEEVMSFFPFLKDRKDQLARTLSGGEQRILALARGLVSRPELLLLDEPFTGLYPKMVKEVVNVLEYFKERGASMLISDHKVSPASSIADRVYLISRGKVAYVSDDVSKGSITKAYMEVVG